MLQEILDLGFTRIELGHGVRLSLMEGVLRRFEEGGFEISSLHNFCPLPVEITRASPDCYQFSASDPRERERAVKHTFQTIDFAARLKARFVVLHMGHSPIDGYTEKLLKLAELGHHNSREYVNAKLEAVRKREAKSQASFDRAKECLQRIADYAGEHGITLGVESRHSYEELPSEAEMIELLEEFAIPQVGYWHDFGHVQVKHNLGFLDHVEWMSMVSPRLVGCHLHDTIWPGRDHHPPFAGDVPYAELLKFLPPETLFVFEMSPRREREDIIAAREKWTALYGA